MAHLNHNGTLVINDIKITPGVEEFFVCNPAIRGGDCTLRDTRLTPEDVLSIVANDELADYPELTAARIAACQNITAHQSVVCNTLPIFNENAFDEVNFTVNRKKWSQLDYTDPSSDTEIFGDLKG